MDGMGSVLESDVVRVGLPVLMGVAAASSPAGARGAGAMLSSLGALDAISSGKERRQEAKTRTELDKASLDLRRQEFEVNKPTATETLLRQRLDAALAEPTPPPAGTEGPPAPPTMTSMLTKLEDLQGTEGGRLLLAGGGPPTMSRYVQGTAAREAKGAGAMIPQFTKDNDLNAQIYQDHGETLRQPDGRWAMPSTTQVQESAARLYDKLQQGKLDVAALTGAGAAVRTAHAQERAAQIAREASDYKVKLEQENFRFSDVRQDQINRLNSMLASVQSLDDFSEEEVNKWVGILKNPLKEMSQLVTEDPRFAHFQAIVGNLEQALAMDRESGGGATFTKGEAELLIKSLMTGRELGGAGQFNAKKGLIRARMETKLKTMLGLATARPGSEDISGMLEQERRAQRDAFKKLYGPGKETPVPGGQTMMTPNAPPPTITQENYDLLMQNSSPQAKELLKRQLQQKGIRVQ